MRASPITTGLENEIPPQKPLSSTLTRTHRHTHTHTHTRCVLSESLDTYNGTVSSLVLIIIGLFIHFRRIFLLKRSPTDSHVVHFTKDRRCVDVTDQLKSTFNDLPAPPSFHYANSRILFPLKVKYFNLKSKENRHGPHRSRRDRVVRVEHTHTQAAGWAEKRKDAVDAYRRHDNNKGAAPKEKGVTGKTLRYSKEKQTLYYFAAGRGEGRGQASCVWAPPTSAPLKGAQFEKTRRGAAFPPCSQLPRHPCHKMRQSI